MSADMAVVLSDLYYYKADNNYSTVIQRCVYIYMLTYVAIKENTEAAYLHM